MNLNLITDFESSNIAGFNRVDGALIIKFKTGGLYRYPHVPSEIFEAMKIANSKGQFFAAHVKNHFEFEKLDAALVG